MPENTLFTYKTEEDGVILSNPHHLLLKQGHKATIYRFRTGESLIAEKIWRALLRLSFESLIRGGLTRYPAVGDAWRLNLRRMAGAGTDREFLSWRPFCSDRLDFSAFGHLVFLGVI